jgi:hypothetical protein
MRSYELYYLYLSINIVRVTNLKRIMEIGYVVYLEKRNCLTILVLPMISSALIVIYLLIDASIL